MKQHLVCVLSVLWFSLCVLSCSEQPTTSSVSKTPAKISTPSKPNNPGASEKIEVPSIFAVKKEEYFYNPVGKRDPFQEYVGELIKDVALPRSPLERYELNELVLTAVVWGISEPRALLRAPDGYSYIVRSNTRVGKNRGKVSRITRRQVFVEEEYRDPTGKLIVRESSFAIREKKQKREQEHENEMVLSEE